jgi:hypothetical protein
LYTYLLIKMEQTECSEMSACKIQTPGNYPEGNIQHTEHGESLKSRVKVCLKSEENKQTFHVDVYVSLWSLTLLVYIIETECSLIGKI